MTKEQIKQEMDRWIDADRPSVWYSDAGRVWVSTDCPRWDEDTVYIVDDEQAELRKLQIDKPDTKFQVKISGEWRDVEPEELWFTTYEYRIKHTEWYEDPDVIEKPIWVRDDDSMRWGIDIFLGYTSGVRFPFECRRSSWKEAKLVKCEDLYQVNKDDK